MAASLLTFGKAGSIDGVCKSAFCLHTFLSDIMLGLLKSNGIVWTLLYHSKK